MKFCLMISPSKIFPLIFCYRKIKEKKGAIWIICITPTCTSSMYHLSLSKHVWRKKKGKVRENLFSCITHHYKSVIKESEVWQSETKEKTQLSISKIATELIRLDIIIFSSSKEENLRDQHLKGGKYRQYIKYLR